MHYFIFPEIDTTIYSRTGSKNTGLDQILEIRKDQKSDGTMIGVSRILMKFDLSYISSSMVRGTITNPKFYLNLYDANPTNLSYSQSLWAWPVSQSWVVGEGFDHDIPVTQQGVSWDFKTGAEEEDYWRLENSQSYNQGGTWHDDVYASQSFVYETRDMRMDVTPIVNKWLDKTYVNEGFILKRSGSLENPTPSGSGDEGSTDMLGNFSFFSRQTNTIYPPKLEVEWYDTKWNTGSLEALSSRELEDLVFYMQSLRPEYKESSKVKFRVVGRGRYPTKSFSNTSSEYLTVKYLPSGSISNIGGDGAYYSVLDSDTEDVIVPYGTGSLISCDSTGNYFNLDMNGFQAERFYKFEFKVISGSGTVDETVEYFDNNFTFKVVR
jgi:hypothetical protein|tara:strand:- start:10 stop:1149 length:1140 start_codon:yes stop_codon:yes gene_type:complete